VRGLALAAALMLSCRHRPDARWYGKELVICRPNEQVGDCLALSRDDRGCDVMRGTFVRIVVWGKGPNEREAYRCATQTGTCEKATQVEVDLEEKTFFLKLPDGSIESGSYSLAVGCSEPAGQGG
jgi:hypothetical protein